MQAGLFAALDIATLVWWVDVSVKVAVALGAVIFVHELGHFLVAKACGVKCEKFMIGFDIGGYRISRKWGETVYGIGILPLGGYVKMLGQDDDPSHIAEQMQKSQVDVDNSNAVPITGPNGETYYVDRRSYLAKSVPQRMAIISAGVVMNVIFAFIFAVIAYGLGVPYQPSIISGTMPGSPAWRAGLQPGDEIIQMGETANPTFTQLRGGVTLGDLQEGIPCLIRRPANDSDAGSSDKEFSIVLKPEPGDEGAKIGVTPPYTVVIRESAPTEKDSPASRAKFIELTGQAPRIDVATGEAVLSGGQIVRVGDAAIRDDRDWQAALAAHPDKPLVITVRRSLQDKAAKNAEGESAQDVTLEMKYEVPVRHMRQFGLAMDMGPIVAIQPDSPAAEAGLAVGDVIEQVNGKTASTSGGVSGWDSSTLPEYLRRAAADGRSVELTLRRAGADGKQPEAKQATISIKPRVPTVYYPALASNTPMGAPAIGIAYRIENTVQQVTAEAAKAGIQAGDEIRNAKLILPKTADGKTPKPEEIELGPKNQSWPAIVTNYQLSPNGTEVELTLVRQGTNESIQARIAPQPTDGLFVAERGFNFQPLERTRLVGSFAEQVRYGWNETVDALTMVVRFLKKLGSPQVPITMLGGPGTIAVAAGAHASQGLASLLIFLTMLSANLAVVNFLPIPLLDGGHMVFLAYEGLRGRPANQKVVVALHTAGFVFILSLMVFVIGLDIQRWIWI